MILAFEIGGTKLQAALGEAGDIRALRRGTVDPACGAQGILAWMRENGGALLAEAGVRPRTVVIGFGGPIDSATGTVLVSHQIGGWDGFRLASWCEEVFGCPTLLENDSNAAGWAEYKLGAGRGTRNFVYMNIGSGIGGAIIIDGRLHNGQGLGAGEIGHTRVPDLWSNVAGSSARLEDRCSGWSIERRLRERVSARDTALWNACAGDISRLTCQHWGDAIGAGDSLALEELDRVSRSIGLALANVITLLHPERIAIGGGVGLLGERLLVPLRAAVEDSVFGPYRGRYDIRGCELQEQVVLRGALLLAEADHAE